MRTMIDRCDVAGKTHVDVGAADGKVLLGALALGAAHVYGLEISGPGLSDKFHAMRDILAQDHPLGGSAARLVPATIGAAPHWAPMPRQVLLIAE